MICEEGTCGHREQRNFRNWDLLGQAGRGTRLLESKEGAMSALNVIPKECGVDPLGRRETEGA